MQVLYQLSYSPLGLINNLLPRVYRQGIVGISFKYPGYFVENLCRSKHWSRQTTSQEFVPNNHAFSSIVIDNTPKSYEDHQSCIGISKVRAVSIDRTNKTH